jgi:sialic acid synthase SpsE
LIIADREISYSNCPLIIAEIGINHGGELKIAKKMVDLAFSTGCEIIKHQTHFIEDEMTSEAKSIFPPNADISIWDVMEKCALSKDEEIQLKKHTEDLGMIYISTPFSRKAADFLAEINVPAFKIGSGEADNLPLIKHIAALGKPVILSTGMQSIQTVEASVKILQSSKISFALLECTNLYPSPPEIVSLKGIAELKKSFPETLVGFSDHSIGPEMALAAIALGACIVERHFTDSRYRIGPDIACSMDPSELKYLIDRSKEIHVARNNPKIRTLPEEDVYKFARSSVVADKDLPIGTILSEKDIWVRRPGSGPIPAYKYEQILGKTLTKSKHFNEYIDWSDIA